MGVSLQQQSQREFYWPLYLIKFQVWEDMMNISYKHCVVIMVFMRY